MAAWLIIGLMTLNAFVSVIQCGSDKDGARSSSDSQEYSTNLINITSAKLHHLNGHYVDKKTYNAGFKRKNSTYTELPLQWDVIKDFPEDTMLITKLVRSKSPDGPWEDVQIYVSKVCDLEDKSHNYLPPFLIELTEKGNCIRKGKHHFDDAGQFQFYLLFPASSLRGWYYNTYNQIRASNSTILIKDLEIKSKSVDV